MSSTDGFNWFGFADFMEQQQLLEQDRLQQGQALRSIVRGES
jgi:hypothetical protein